MPSMPWIKLYTEALDDPKLGRLSNDAQLCFFKLLLLAGECDAEGYLVNGAEPLTCDDMAWRLRLDRDLLDHCLDELEDNNLLADESGVYVVINFADRQGRSQTEKREMWRERKRRQRDVQRDIEDDTEDSHAGVTREQLGCHADVTPLEREKDLEKRERKREGEKSKPADAGPPTISTDFTTFQEWLDHIRASKNPVAALRTMHERLYPGHDPPSYGEIGSAIKTPGIGAAGRLAQLMWEYSTRPPTGNVISYLRAVAKGKGSDGSGKTDHRTDRAKPVDPEVLARQRKALREGISPGQRAPT